MKVFDFLSYQEFIQKSLQTRPNKGRGEAKRLAQFLGVHSTFISQIFRGHKSLSLEHAIGICEYLGLTELETEYFLALVHIERAGSVKLRRLHEKQAQRLREKGAQLAHRLPRDKELSDVEKAVFYSEWYYSAIRILSSVPGYQAPGAIAAQLNLPLALVNQTLAFLVQHGLCVEKDGQYHVGPRRTHLEADSPFVNRHRTNWHLQAVERFPDLTADEFAFSAPLSIGKKDFLRVRQELVRVVEVVSNIIADHEPETAACLNIAWFGLR